MRLSNINQGVTSRIQIEQKSLQKSLLDKWFKSGKNFGARGRSRTGTRLRARDFKSLVSTNFTTRADGRCRSNNGAYSITITENIAKLFHHFLIIFLHLHFQSAFCTRNTKKPRSATPNILKKLKRTANSIRMRFY